MTDRGMSAALMQKLRALAEAPLRFPLPLACAVLWAGLTVAHEHGFGFTDRQTIGQIQLFLILGLFLSLSAKLFAESRNWSIIRWLPLTAGALGLLALIVFLGPQMRDELQFMGPGLILLMIVSPFLQRRAENHLIWDFNFKSWTNAAFGLLVAMVLALAMLAVFGALKILFGLNISHAYYLDIWIVCFGVIWPWQTLAGVPGGFGAAREEYCPHWIDYLIGWLLVPMALIYLAVLYAFAAKIAIQWTLPEGQVGRLVVGFAGFGLLVWHVAHPLRETGSRLVRFYVRFFHPALLVPVGLLAIGVGVRVAEYGITELRYGLIALTLGLAGIAVHGVIVRAPRLNIAPITFSVLLILASFGPWGAGAVSLHSQLGQLDALLVEAGVLRDGKLSPADESVDSELAKRISSVVTYLNHPERDQTLYEHLGRGGIELAAGSSRVDVVAALGMEYINRGNSRIWSRPPPSTLDTHGFDAVWINTDGRDEQSQPVEIGDSETRVHATTNGTILEISTNDRGPVTIDLAQLVETLKRDGSPGYNKAVNDPLMTVEAHGNGLKTRIYFNWIKIQDSTGAFKVQKLSFTALIGAEGDGQ